MNYTVIIGLEVHVQLLTRSKIFCGCTTQFNPDEPNTQTCPVCLGLPGSLPVMNREAFHLALKTALSLHCDISPFTKWDRKQYYYPDLPKNYQISQFDLPFSHDGWLEIVLDPESGEKTRVGIIRAHLEEDAGKNLHDESGGRNDSQVDLNRTGTPLLEIVSEPDLRSAAAARKYLEELKLLLTYLEVSDCNMQEGSLRCDANVNLHVHTDDGHNVATPIVEIKNLNSFRNTELAIAYEVERQARQFQETGHKYGDVPKETRGFDADRGVTFSQRSKEEVSDYRYFPDPDLVPVTVETEQIDAVRAEMCELPAERRARFLDGYGLSAYDASVIIDQGRELADYFEEVAQGCGDGKQAANWLTQDVLRELNDRKQTIAEFPIRPPVLAALLKRINDKQITIKSAREVFVALCEGLRAKGLGLRAKDAGGPGPSALVPQPSALSSQLIARIDEIVAAKGLAIVADTGELAGVIEAVLARNAKAVADFQAGKQAAIGALIGQVMREVKGADPQTVRQMLVERLQG